MLLSLQDHRRRNQGLLEVAWGSGICLQSSSQDFLEKQQWSNLKCSKLLINKLELLGVKLLKNFSIDLDAPAYFWAHNTKYGLSTIKKKKCVAAFSQWPRGGTSPGAHQQGLAQQMWHRDIPELWGGRTFRHTLQHRCLPNTFCGMK